MNTATPLSLKDFVKFARPCMKVTGLILVSIAAAVGTPAQATADGGPPPDVLVLSQEWSETAFLPDWDRAPNSSLPPGTTDPAQIIRETSSLRPAKLFQYTIKVRNTGTRDVLAIHWDYVFIDAGTNGEASRHQFLVTEKVRPGGEKTLTGASASAPSKVVSAGALGKDGRRPFIERVVINCIAYSDGSRWKRPGFDGSCEPEKPLRRLRRY
jgi:hypothetical protein